MDEELKRLVDDYLHRKQAALDAEARLLHHWAQSHEAHRATDTPHPADPLRSAAGRTLPHLKLPHLKRPRLKLPTLQPARLYAAAGTAAVALVVTLLLLLTPGQTKDYARIRGEVTDRPEIIAPYVAGKLQRAGLALSGCLNPLDNLQRLKSGCNQSNATLYRLQERMFNLYDHLPLKTNRYEEEINDSARVSLPAGNDGERPNP